MQTLDNYNFAGKKAFVRVDFNVPLDENFNITDDTRMVKALPTLKKILYGTSCSCLYGLDGRILLSRKQNVRIPHG